MEIRMAYQTSKGIYITKEKAEANRASIVHTDRFDKWKEKEKVVDIWVLLSDDRAFVLNPIQIIA